MRREGLRWYVFGAQAAAVYGRPRMTGDVDIVVEMPVIDTVGLVGRLSDAGFELRLPPGDEFLRESTLLPLVHRATEMPVDLVIATSALHGELLDRRKLVELGSLRVPMICPEDLIVTKVLAGRPKDLEDIRGILLEQSELDVEHIRRLLRELQAALEDNRLVRRFERALRAAQAV